MARLHTSLSRAAVRVALAAGLAATTFLPGAPLGNALTAHAQTCSGGGEKYGYGGEGLQVYLHYAYVGCGVVIWDFDSYNVYAYTVTMEARSRDWVCGTLRYDIDATVNATDQISQQDTEDYPDGCGLQADEYGQQWYSGTYFTAYVNY